MPIEGAILVQLPVAEFFTQDNDMICGYCTTAKFGDV